MSAPLAGKFQDHYAVLGVSPKADPDTIQQAYAKLAQKYFPNNAVTGDAEKFEALNMAYETLSDPELRALFDKVKGVGQDEGGPKFSGPEFFNGLEREEMLRSVILCVLYDRRRANPSTPSLSMRHLEFIVEASSTELVSALWYLKQRGLVASDDKSSLQITVDGMDNLQNAKPSADDVMPFIKESARPAAPAQTSQAQPAQAPTKREPESVMATLNRALSRTSA
jgi:curved DNA-binding protein CbpA